jgi:hypothetical protein
MSPKVYISIGSATTAAQRRAADVIFRSLETAGMSPRQMERNEWTAEQPLRGIKRVIEQCHGVVVVAFSRYQFPSGTERQKDGGEKHLSNIQVTTVWNHIEAAMGYTRGLPLFVIAEQGLLSDGLLEGRYDWKVYWTDFSDEELGSDAFVGYLASWKQLVLEHSAILSTADVDLSKLSIRQICARLTIPQAWMTISAFVGFMATVATVGFWVGSGKWPWK